MDREQITYHAVTHWGRSSIRYPPLVGMLALSPPVGAPEAPRQPRAVEEGPDRRCRASRGRAVVQPPPSRARPPPASGLQKHPRRLALPCSGMAAGPESGGECGICYEAYQGVRGGRAPRRLPCSHSLCQNCLHKLVCRAATVAFISCPFCRMVTLMPEMAPGGRGMTAIPGTPHRARLTAGEEEEENEGSGAHWASGHSVAMEVACAAHAPVFTVSSMVAPCSLRRGPEAPGAFVLGLPGRGLLLDSQPPLTSVENLRLGFAAGILILIVATFFLLVFLK